MLIALMLAACGGPPPTVTPALSPTPTVRTPLPTPSTRTAPTLPPEFTSTPTPTITPTPTPSATFTATATPDAATICATVSWFGPLLDGRTLADDAAFLLDITVGWRDAVAVLSWRDPETDEGDQVGLEGGSSALLNIEEVFGPGTYEMRLEVFTAAYANICEQQITFTILPGATATPDGSATPGVTPTPSIESLLIEILTLIRDRLRTGE